MTEFLAPLCAETINKITAESNHLVALGGDLFTHILYHKISKKSSLVFAILLCYNL